MPAPRRRRRFPHDAASSSSPGRGRPPLASPPPPLRSDLSPARSGRSSLSRRSPGSASPRRPGSGHPPSRPLEPPRALPPRERLSFRAGSAARRPARPGLSEVNASPDPARAAPRRPRGHRSPPEGHVGDRRGCLRLRRTGEPPAREPGGGEAPRAPVERSRLGAEPLASPRCSRARRRASRSDLPGRPGGSTCGGTFRQRGKPMQLSSSPT